jgi:hypothetical protein
MFYDKNKQIDIISKRKFVSLNFSLTMLVEIDMVIQMMELFDQFDE